MRQRLVIIADDLTGACDAAGTLTRYGPVPVALDGRIPSGRISAIDLDTRRLTGPAARRRVARTVRRLAPEIFLYKKVDSQLRGNVAEELNGVLLARPAPLLFVPALPEEGRTTLAGIHRAGRRHIALRQALKGLTSPLRFVDPTRLKRPSADSSTVLTGDATSRRDLRRWARLARVLPAAAGSAGLSAEIPRALGWRQRNNRSRWRRARRTLVAIGSREKTARMQLRALARARQCMIRSPLHFGAILLDLSQGLALVEGESAALARTVARLGPGAIDAVVLCGGETARAVLTRSDATMLVVKGEILPRVPLAAIRGGRFHGKYAVTKAGSFGPLDALIRVVATLEQGHA